MHSPEMNVRRATYYIRRIKLEWEENDEKRKKGNVRSVLLERTHIIASIVASTKAKNALLGHLTRAARLLM